MPDDIDTTTDSPEFNPRIESVDLQVEMQRSYMDYAMSVIVSRALPDVRDGLKPVHRRVLYAMFDGGYRPDRGFSKCARIVGDVMGNYHPHGDSSIYDTLVRLSQPWALRYPLVQGQGNFGSPGNDPAAAMRYTEARMAPLAMEMVRDIDEETVDFTPNYDGRTQEPVILPSRFPNLLVNGSAGIAVGMATNIPPHNLGEVSEAAQWALAHPEASREEMLEAFLERVKGPDFPTGGLIVGRKGIEDAYRTGRGSVMMRAEVEVQEDNRGRTLLVVTQLPYQVNPDNLLLRIAELANEGKIAGISDVRDDSSSRTGMRLVIELKRDAVAKVVLNNLFKHTQLQDNFSCNMIALVDGIPRTLPLDGFIRHWISHQIEVIVRRTRYRLRKAEERAHILLGLLKALDALDDVIALIRASATVDDARTGLMTLLEVDEVQATAILDMQLRRLAALERQKIIDEYDELQAKIADYNDILTNEPRQRSIVSEELAEITAKYADERRSIIIPWDGEVTDEDLIAEEDVVVTITRGGYAKRTLANLYRAQRRGGKGVRGASLRGDDVVEHFFVTTTHHYLLFFTNKGRVYRAKAYELPDSGRDARGQHVANLLAFQPEETDRAGARRARLRGSAVPRARHARRHGEEDQARGLRLQPQRRRHRDQPARRRRAHLRAARRRRRRPAAGERQGDVGAVHRERRHPAAHGSRDLRRDRHALPRGRPPAGDGHRAPRVVRRHRHRRRLREAHAGRRLDAEGPRHLRRARHEARRGPRLARGRARGERGRRGLRHRLRRRRDPHPRGRDPFHRPRHDGCLAHGRERRQRHRRGRARRRLGRRRGRRRRGSRGRR